MLISIDCESTGHDIALGARPFMVSVCGDDGRQLLWQWDVDPITRAVSIPEGDANEIRAAVNGADEVVGQNLKYDAKHLAGAGVIEKWPWHKSHDTLIAAHVLASAMPHNLTDLVLHYIGDDIKPYEDALGEACVAARRIVQSKSFTAAESADLFNEGGRLKWRIADEEDPDMPSISSKAWHFDYWLPRCVAEYLGYAPDHPWRKVCSTYAKKDSSYTLLLWKHMRRELEQRRLWKIYKEEMNLPEVIADMETRGVTYNHTIGRQLGDQYKKESEEAAKRCVAIAGSIGYDLVLPKRGKRNKSLQMFCFGADECKCEICGETYMDIPGKGPHECLARKCKSIRIKVTKKKYLDLPNTSFYTDSGSPSLSADAFKEWEETLPPGPQLDFVSALQTKGERDTFVSYSDSYAKFAVPISQHPAYGLLLPTLNQTGTAHLRMSSEKPNGQNVSKKKRTCRACKGKGEVNDRECVVCEGEGEVNFSLRRAFCPLPGMELWAFDYENIELVIPAYEGNVKKMIELFEKPNEPPFYGSYHLLCASFAYPDLFWPTAGFPPGHRESFKKKYASTWYQWIKNTDFAKSYRAGEAKVDATAHRVGVYAAINRELSELEALADKYLDFARKHGYVETIPDKTVDPERGYPIMTSRGPHGDVSPTIPFNYHISGTACQAMRKAMPRVYHYLKEITKQTGQEHRIALQIHDELLCVFPSGGRRNLAKARMVKSLMEKSGDDIGIPLRVSMNYHPKNWQDNESYEAKEAA